MSRDDDRCARPECGHYLVAHGASFASRGQGPCLVGLCACKEPVRDDTTVEIHRVRLYCNNRWAEFDGSDKEQKWSAPLIAYPDGEVMASSYRYLLSSAISDKEALAKLQLIRRAQRMAVKENAK